MGRIRSVTSFRLFGVLLITLSFCSYAQSPPRVSNTINEYERNPSINNLTEALTHCHAIILVLPDNDKNSFKSLVYSKIAKKEFEYIGTDEQSVEYMSQKSGEYAWTLFKYISKLSDEFGLNPKEGGGAHLRFASAMEALDRDVSRCNTFVNTL